MSIKDKKLVKAFLSPYFISLVLTIPLCIFLAQYFPKYESKLVSREPVIKKDGISYFHDIDNDGYSEEILSFTDTKGNASIQIYKQQGKISDLIDFNGGLPFRGVRLIAGDFDKDQDQEIYNFYVRHDSLFLSGTEFSKQKVRFINDRFITFLGNDLGVIDCNIYQTGLYDLDNDGSDEVIFSVMAGFPVFPRNIFAFDINEDTLLVSPFTGATSSNVEVYDLNGDGMKELFVQTYAPGNMKNMEYNGLIDTSAWLIVLDNRLRFKIPPYEFNGYTSGVVSTPFKRNNKGYIGAIVRRKTFPPKPLELFTFDEYGKLISKKFLESIAGEGVPKPIQNEYFKSSFSLIDNSGFILQYDENLNLQKKVSKGLKKNWNYFFFTDLDQDGEKENILYTGKGDVVITRFDFSSPVTLIINGDPQLLSMGIKLNGNELPEVMLQSDRSIYLVSYDKNPFFFWQYPLFLGIYLFFSLLITMVLYIQRKILKDKYEAEKRISELQLMMVKDQLDPHFMFNAMNTINSLVILKKPEEAQKRIVGLSRLMRTVVESSGKISQSLGHEIEFIRDYLEFQQKRYGDLFTYSIEMEPGIDMNIQVPRMVMQIPVENSIKHGLLPMEKGGAIRILVRKDETNLKITIEDNGIGREEAKRRNISSTGKGLSILEQNFEILNRYNTEKAKFEIHDLNSPGNMATGTKIIISIPVNLNYKIYER
jgi:two-component sensor histidine kinase